MTLKSQLPPEEQINSLIALYSSGQIQKAFDAVEALIKDYPNEALFYNISGACYASLGHLDKAVRRYKEAIGINPSYAEAHNNLGITLQELGKMDEAVKSYEQAITIKPDFAEALNNLGISLQELGQLDAAVKNYKKAISIKSEFANAHYNLGLTLERLGSISQLNLAINCYEKTLAIQPDFADVHNHLGNVRSDLGQLDRAVQSYEKAIGLNSNFAEAFNNLGNALQELGKMDEAVKSYEQAIKIEPDFAEVYYNLGVTFQNLNQLGEAVKSYEKALIIKPDYTEADNNLTFTLQELDQQGPSQKKWIGKSIEKQKIEEFLRLVKPIKTNHKLIRVGGDSDGGYLIPNDIENIGVCFSPGVSDIANFENELTKKGIKCFLADYSVEKPPIKNDLFDFEKKYLGNQNNEIYMTLESWVENKAPKKTDFILQMDIEGSEYSTINDTPLEILNKFRILVIEFHGLDALFDKMLFDSINLTFKKILKQFEVVHIHPNNCIKPLECNGIVIPPFMEFTFLRKDRITKKGRNLSFPHQLDRPNVENYADFSLPKCWF